MYLYIDTLVSDDLDYLPVIASLPAQQTTFEYLVGCWRRVNLTRSALIKKVNKFSTEILAKIFKHYQGYSPLDTQNALVRLEKIRELIISYAGLTLQEPEMFPQPAGYAIFHIWNFSNPFVDVPLAHPNSSHRFYLCLLFPHLYIHPRHHLIHSQPQMLNNFSRTLLAVLSPITKSMRFSGQLSSNFFSMNPFSDPKG